MKIVIDIPKEYAKQFYENKCKDKFDNLATNEFGYVLRKAFENGTPLPEHHGRLIDADVLQTEMKKDVRKAMSFVDLTDFVWLAPTIIEGSDSE